MSDFVTVRQTVRASETDGEALLVQLADLVQNPAESTTVETQIDTNLGERGALIQTLFGLAHGTGALLAWLHQAQRHSETLDDHRRTAKRLRSAVSQERSRRTLLSSVRQDIQTHRSGSGQRSMTTSAEGSADADAYYGDERQRVNASHSIADTLLASAYEARAELMNQQNTLRDAQRRLMKAASQIPGINTLISKINSRQKRNSLILATVIVLCVLFIVFVR